MWKPVRINNKNWEEIVEIDFRTTKLPDSIPSDLIPKTVPFVNQEFFLQDEITALSPGRIMLLDDLEEDYFYDEKDGKEYEYHAVFKQASNQEEVSRESAVYSNYQALYNIPQLENNTRYLVQIIRKPVPTGGTVDNHLHALSSYRIVYQGSYQELLSDSLSFDYRVESPAPEIDPQFLVEPGETLLYSYYFTTSAFDRLEDKMEGVELEVENKNNFEKLTFEHFEGFDTYDIEGLITYDGHGQLDEFYSSDPLIRIEDMFTSEFHDDYTKPLIGQPYVAYMDDYAGEHNGTYIEGPEIEDDFFGGGSFEGGGGSNFYVGQSLSMNGLAYHAPPVPALELGTSYGYPYPLPGLSLCAEFPGPPQLNYGWSNYSTLTEWLNDNVTEGIIDPGESSNSEMNNMFHGFSMGHLMLNQNTSGTLTLKYFVTEYCIQDAEELIDHYERALDDADTSPDEHCTDLSGAAWANYLDGLEAKIEILSESPLVNGFNTSGFENSIRFRANKSYLYDVNTPGSSFTKTFRTNGMTIEYLPPQFIQH